MGLVDAFANLGRTVVHQPQDGLEQQALEEEKQNQEIDDLQDKPYPVDA